MGLCRLWNGAGAGAGAGRCWPGGLLSMQSHCSWRCNKNLSHLLLLGVYEFSSRDFHNAHQVLAVSLSVSLSSAWGLVAGFGAGWRSGGGTDKMTRHCQMDKH